MHDTGPPGRVTNYDGRTARMTSDERRRLRDAVSDARKRQSVARPVAAEERGARPRQPTRLSRAVDVQLEIEVVDARRELGQAIPQLAGKRVELPHPLGESVALADEDGSSGFGPPGPVVRVVDAAAQADGQRDRHGAGDQGGDEPDGKRDSHRASLTGQSGDVDAAGDIVDELFYRLRDLIPAESAVTPTEQAALVAGVLHSRGIR